MNLHELLKDFVIPLAAPLVAIVVPTILFYVIPRRWQRHNLSLELFETFFREDMRIARLEAWTHFVTELDAESGQRRQRTFELFRDFLTQPETGRRIDARTHELFQKASRVLDFFAIVDGCLARGAVDPRMIRSFLAYYYFWWRLMVLQPLRALPNGQPARVRHLPIWWKELPHLDRVCRIEPGTERLEASTPGH